MRTLWLIGPQEGTGAPKEIILKEEIIRMSRTFLTVAVLLFLIHCVPAHAKPLAIHMLSGSKEYKSEESLKLWSEHLKQNYGFKSTISWGTDKITFVENLESMDKADVLVVFCRRWELEGEQAKRIRDWCESGKPILGIRTASHAFQFFLEFDQEILGGDYEGHDGGGVEVQITRNEENTGHPILKEVSDWSRDGKLYFNPNIADDVVLLLSGRTEENEAPVAWARENGKQRIFYTSLGIPDDFRNENFLRLLDNGLHWLVEQR